MLAGVVETTTAAIVGVAAVLALAAKGWQVLRRMDRRLEYVDREMRHNGGKTVRDQVARTDGNVLRIADALHEHGIDVPIERPPAPTRPSVDPSGG